MNNGISSKTGLWYTLRKWLLPSIVLLTTLGALLYTFLSMRQTVWCYLTDDVSIRENALDAKPRLVVWEEPHRVLEASDASSYAQRAVFTPDGATVIFSSKQGGETNIHLYSSIWNGRNWGKPVFLETVNSSANDKDPAITPDGRFLYFSSDRPGGFGGYDIWLARWNGVKWTDPTNAGPSINTQQDEVAPAISPDGDRLYFSSTRPDSDSRPSTGHDLDIFSAEIKTPDATNTIKPDISSAANVTVPDTKQKSPAKRKAAKKSQAIKTETVYKTTLADTRKEPLPALPQFGAVRRMDILNSPADDLNVCFTTRGDMLYFDSNRKGGSGGFDVYGSRIVQGELQPPQNLGVEINSPADDRAPAVRMEGFDQLFSSNRGSGDGVKFHLYSSTAREVVSKVDLSRLHLLIGRFFAVKWWIVAFIAAVIALVYLTQHYRDLTNLFHKCLMASAIIHMVALLVVSSLKIHSKMNEETAPPTAMEEVTVGTDALAREKMAIEMAENVIGRPQGLGGGGGGNGTPMSGSEITLVAKQASEFVPMPDFQPQKTAPGITSVARSTLNPVILEEAPSRGQESSTKGDFQPAPATGTSQSSVKIAANLDALPEVAAPRVDVVMEEKSTTTESKTPASDVAFQPLMNVPVASTVRVAPAAVAEVLSSVRPLNITPSVGAVAIVTNSVIGAKSLVGGSGEGDAAFDTKDTGGLFARRSGGSDVSSGTRPLSGLGENITARLASSENGTGTGMGSGGGIGSGTGTGVGNGSGPGLGSGNGGGLGNGAPNMMEVPDGFEVSPYMLRKKGGPGGSTTGIIDGLGGSRETEAAVERALQWLANHQEGDGHWSMQKHGGQAQHDIAATSLSLLCYLGWGANPQEPGKYQNTAAKALDWLRGQVLADGNARGHGDMYDQGMATIALTEAYALAKDKSLGLVVRNAAGFIIRAQHSSTGGWRYQPGESGDTSVVGWQLMALCSARMAGVSVPQETLDLADKWLTSVGGGEHGGLYGYENKNPKPSMAAEGMFCRQIMGDLADSVRMKETADYLQTQLPKDGHPPDFYYLYYGTLAMNQYRGPAWDAWNTQLKLILPHLQATSGDEAGSWEPAGEHGNAMGRIVSTALATLSLEVYYRYLPFAHSKGKVTKTETVPVGSKNSSILNSVK